MRLAIIILMLGIISTGCTQVIDGNFVQQVDRNGNLTREKIETTSVGVYGFQTSRSEVRYYLNGGHVTTTDRDWETSGRDNAQHQYNYC